MRERAVTGAPLRQCSSENMATLDTSSGWFEFVEDPATHQNNCFELHFSQNCHHTFFFQANITLFGFRGCFEIQNSETGCTECVDWVWDG